MTMTNVKEAIEKAANKLLTDKNLRKKFDTNPVAVIEELIGVDLPDDIVNQLIAGIRVKLSQEKLGDMLSGLGGIFGKR